MKKTTRLSIFLNKVFKGMTPINAIDKMEYSLSKNKEIFEKFNSDHSKAKAILKSKNEELDKIKEMSRKLLSISQSTLKSEDVVLEAKKKLSELEMMHNVIVKQIEQQKMIVAHHEKVIKKLDDEISSLEMKANIIRSQVEFSKNVSKFKEIEGTSFDINIDDLIKEVNIEFDASVFDLEKMDNKTSELDQLLNSPKEASEDFIKMIGGNNE